VEEENVEIYFPKNVDQHFHENVGEKVWEKR
jgi:hypothetical protein